MISKKSQMTIFIIVGLAMLLIGSIYLVLRDVSMRDAFGNQEKELIVEEVDANFKPVQDFVTECVSIMAEQGLRQLGRSGGYLDDEMLMTNKANPTHKNAEAVSFWPGNDDYRIAYWWRMDAKEDCFESGACTFERGQPPLEGSENSFERKLEMYITEKVQSCLADFEAMEESGFAIEARDDLATDVTFASDDVFVEVDYPIDARLGDAEQKLTFFNTRLDIDFRTMYEMADEITTMEADTAFFENYLIEIISLYSGTDEDALLPPFFATGELKASGNTKLLWSRSEVKQSLASLISMYTSMVTALYSRNYETIDSEDAYTEAIINRMTVFLNDTDYAQFTADFSYKSWWDLYLNIDDQEILKPQSMVPLNLDLVPLFGPMLSSVVPLQYKFNYDVAFPVLVTLGDPDAFNGDGFTFNFFLESNLQSNMPAFSSSDISAQGDVLFPSNLYCRDSNFATSNVTLTFVDPTVDMELEDVLIEYRCGPNSCMMGATDNHGDGTYFRSPFPACMGGVLSVSKPGYNPKTIPFSTELGVDDYHLPTFELEPLRSVSATAKIYGLKRMQHFDGLTMQTRWSVDFNNTHDLRDGEVAIITLEKVKSDPLEDDFTRTISVDYDEPTMDVTLIPGEYEVSATLLVDASEGSFSPVVIPAKTEEVDTNGWLPGGKEDIDYPEIDFGDFFPEGGVELDSDHGSTWQVSESDLSGSQSLTFYLIASPYIDFQPDLTYDELVLVGRYDELSATHRHRLTPCFGGGCP